MSWRDFADRAACNFGRGARLAATAVIALAEALIRVGSGRLRYAFAHLSLLGKGIVIAAALFFMGWLVAGLGLTSVARELDGAAWTLLSVILAAAIVRHIFTRMTHRSRYSSWTGR